MAKHHDFVRFFRYKYFVVSFLIIVLKFSAPQFVGFYPAGYIQPAQPNCFTYCFPTVPQFQWHVNYPFPISTCPEVVPEPGPIPIPLPTTPPPPPTFVPDTPTPTTPTNIEVEITEQSAPSPETNECQLTLSAAECVSNPLCRYCLDEATSIKCETETNMKTNDCLNIYSPDGPDIAVGNNSSATPLHLIPSIKRNFTVTFEIGSYPVDVYCLMDFSLPTSSYGFNYKEALVKLSPEIISTVKGLNPDYTLGYGSYVDKPVSPLGSTTDYSIWNQVALTKDTSTFTDAINNTKMLNGADVQDGVIDASYQIAACLGNVGWRGKSRKILFATAHQPFHVAGDGIAHGLSKFDDKCHLSSVGRYTEEAKLDYPSIEELNGVLTKNDIVIVFAITSELEELYNELSGNLTGSKVVVMNDDVGGIPKAIQSAYNELDESIEIESESSGDDFELTYYSKCAGDDISVTSICELPSNRKVTYIVEIELKNCTSDKKVILKPVGIPIHVDIDVSSVC